MYLIEKDDKVSDENSTDLINTNLLSKIFGNTLATRQTTRLVFYNLKL